MDWLDLSRLKQLQAVVAPSKFSRLTHAVLAVVWIALPAHTIATLGDAPGELGPLLLGSLAACALSWMSLKRVILCYQFDRGVLRCICLNVFVVWEDTLNGLSGVERASARGYNAVTFIWPNRTRRLVLSVLDIGAAIDRAETPNYRLERP